MTIIGTLPVIAPGLRLPAAGCCPDSVGVPRLAKALARILIVVGVDPVGFVDITPLPGTSSMFLAVLGVPPPVGLWLNQAVLLDVTVSLVGKVGAFFSPFFLDFLACAAVSGGGAESPRSLSLTLLTLLVKLSSIGLLLALGPDMVRLCLIVVVFFQKG